MQLHSGVSDKEPEKRICFLAPSNHVIEIGKGSHIRVRVMREAQEIRMLFPVVLGSLGSIALNGDCRILRRFLYLLCLRLYRLSSCLFAWKIKLYLIWGSIGEDHYFVSRTANLNGNTRISLLKCRDFKRPFLFLC